MSGREGPTDRSTGLLEGRARPSGTAETLVGGDPEVPMSLTWDYSKVSIFTGNEKCREHELIFLAIWRQRIERQEYISGGEGIADEVWDL
jgi:hypothetical protein